MSGTLAPLSVPALTPVRIAEIAHELRAPLGGIDAMVELLETSGLDATQRSLVAALKASLAHLRSIADEVLTGSAGRAESDGPMQSLGDFLAKFETACRARAMSKVKGGTRMLEFGLASGADLAAQASILQVPIEPGPLRQVLENLIDNAIRLTPSGRIELGVTLSEAGRLTFCLTDEGPGITRDEADRLIREGGGIAGRPGGAGLGLSIAGRIVTRHGGRLTGGPGPAGKGARFTFDWPTAEAEHGRQETSRRETCLIVDDHPASRLVMRTILAAAGYRCLEAAGIDEALVRVKESHPVFVLTDLNMPDGNGAQLIERIAMLAPDQRPKLVVVSAEAIEAGHPLHTRIDAAIQKPITVRAVLETLAGLETQAALAPGKAVRAA